MTKKTKIVEYTRTHYARSEGDPVVLRIEDSIAIDLELPASYARDLLADLARAIAEGAGDHESAQIALDVPFRLHLTPMGAEQLIARLKQVTGSDQ